MARTTNITFDQVAAAANAIKAAGEKPTARRVRETLGTGSMATVLRFFQQWQGGGTINQVEDDDLSINLDPTIIKAITTAIAAQVAAASVEAAQKIAELEGDRLALMQEVERLTADNNAYEAEVNQLRLHTANMAGQLDSLKTEHIDAKAALGKSQAGEKAAEVVAEIAKAKLETSEEIRKALTIRLADKSHELEISRDEAATLRGMLAAREKTGLANPEKPAPAKARPSRAKPKAAPSPASNVKAKNHDHT